MLRSRFAYAFAGNDGYPPTIAAHALPDRLELGDAVLTVVDQPHGSITSAGLVFACRGRTFVYATDLHAMTDEMRTAYARADVWIIDALRRHPHPTHPHVAQVLAWVDELAPRQVFLTHMDASMDYDTLCAELPAHVRPAHDGLEIEP